MTQLYIPLGLIILQMQIAYARKIHRNKISQVRICFLIRQFNLNKVMHFQK